MCIAWPMRIVELLDGPYATAEIDGINRRVSLRLLDNVNVGDHVLVHAGFAIEKNRARKGAGTAEDYGRTQIRSFHKKLTC